MNEASTTAEFFGKMPIRMSPNDCPDCGTRMEFVFEPEPHRHCPACDRTVQAATVMTGEHAEPHIRKPRVSYAAQPV